MTLEVAVKTGDMFPDVETTVLDQDGVAVDVSGAVIKFSIRTSRTPATVIDAAAGVVVDGPTGKIAYRWTSGDATNVAPGTYEAEFKVTPTSGDSFRVPTEGYILVHFEAHVGT